jgi:hypothetical protein
MLVSCLAYSSPLKIEWRDDFQRTTCYYIAEYRSLYKHRCENLKFYRVHYVSNPLYCHVSEVPWVIITGSGLDGWIYWHFYYNYS